MKDVNRKRRGRERAYDYDSSRINLNKGEAQNYTDNTMSD
jgi:hypothetical protein